MIYNIVKNKKQRDYLCFLFLYFSFVAIPPRICRSALFLSKITFTSLYKVGFKAFSLSDTSLCTVLLEILNTLAVCRTVALFSIMYCPKVTQRSSGNPFKVNTPLDMSLEKYMRV